MGKEWHFRGRSSRRSTDVTVDHHHHHRPSLPSCMSTLFHFFDFHSSHLPTHFVFNKHHSSSVDLSRHPALPKASPPGVEAPRNSLDLDEASISCLRNREENLQIQMGLQIKTRNDSTESKASELQRLPNIDHIALESPSAKTPNLLARLMGLDILPQTSSPSSFSNYCQPKPRACCHVSGTHSLPESPSVSSARLSDVNRHHRRLSIQISLGKENIEIHQETKQERKTTRKKVALVDITNNNKKLEFNEPEFDFRRSKVEKSSKKLKKTVVVESNTKHRNQEAVISEKQKPILIPMARPRSRPRTKAKPRGEEEEAFGYPKSNNLLNNLDCPTKFSIKKEPSPPTAKIPHEQPCSYPKGKQKQPAGGGGERNAVDSTANTDGGAAELRYIKTILTTHGISMNSPISSPNWFSPTNPLNPAIFLHVETTAAAAAVEGPTKYRWNRRLLFQLVDEVLGEIFLRKSWHVGRAMKGWELVEEVREKVEESTRGNCQVLEDIDALIDKDLGRLSNSVGEIEGIVKVVEFHILDSLLRETIAAIYPNAVVCSHDA